MNSPWPLWLALALTAAGLLWIGWLLWIQAVAEDLDLAGDRS